VCNFSGIENEHEILSCAQLEAQQELSKVVDANALGAIKKNADTKVVKRDNIVLGISDLKQKKVDVKVAIGDGKSAVKSGQVVITPIDTIKVNNCEIVSRRPRSVTAAIFGNPLPKVEQVAEKATTVNKTRAQSATAKIFRQNPQNVTSVTSTIFAPRTEEMNKGFLTFSEDEAGLTSEYLCASINIEVCQDAT
jgi:hypoxia-inducible factor 1 alpha